MCYSFALVTTPTLLPISPPISIHKLVHEQEQEEIATALAKVKAAYEVCVSCAMKVEFRTPKKHLGVWHVDVVNL